MTASKTSAAIQRIQDRIRVRHEARAKVSAQRYVDPEELGVKTETPDERHNRIMGDATAWQRI